MQNFTLLKEVGKLNKPILLKRGLSSTYEEWLMAAEYIMSEAMNKLYYANVVFAHSNLKHVIH